MTDKEVERFLNAKETLKKSGSNLVLKEYDNYNKPLKAYCPDCKQVFSTYMITIKNNHGCCPCCKGGVVIKGFNTFGDLYPDLIKYFKNKEDAFSHSYGSGEKIEMKCPDCGMEFTMALNHLSKRGFSCPICSDKVSLPNRILRAFLKSVSKQIEKYGFEKDFDWSQGKIYDGFFIKNGKKYLVEMQGEQHYKDTWNSKEETQENDRLKAQLAEENGFELIVIDCENSNFNYIKKSIMNSKLRELFSIRKRNWDAIFKQATSSLIVKAAELYNNGITSPTQIGKELGVHRKTVQNYLEKASQLKMINYEKKINPTYSINVYDAFDTLLFKEIGLKDCVRNLENLNPQTHLETIKKYCDTRILYRNYYFYSSDKDPHNKIIDKSQINDL
jgi:Zn finger protein HypA/HybF involved in hydrogenase expression